MIGGVILAAALASTPDSPAARVAGLWRSPTDGGSVVRLAPCGEAICGRIVSSTRLKADPNQRDIRNRDESQRDRVLRDLLFLKVRPIGPNRWGDGWVYNPEDGATYKGVMELKADGTLRLTGCVVAPLCKTQTWRRAD